MITGGNFSPYRSPAGNVPFFCAIYAHASGDDQHDQYANTTKVPDPQGGADRAPYERDNPALASSTGCDANGNCTDPSRVCAQWIGTNQTTATKQYTMVDGLTETAPQSFDATGDQVNFAVCHKQGFKNVAAKRQWHGRFGFKDIVQDVFTDLCTFDAGELDTHVGFTGFVRTGYVASPPQTKYRTATVSITGTQTQTPFGGGSPIIATATCDSVSTVDAQSGEITNTGTYTHDPGETESDDTLRSALGFIGGNDWNSAYEYFAAFISLPGVLPGNAHYANPSTGVYQLWIDLITGQPREELGISPGVTATTFYRKVWNGPGVLILHETCSVSNSEIDYTYMQFDGADGPGTNSDLLEATASIVLSDPNTAGDIYSDLQALLGYWPLNDDALYPWRTDGVTNVAPKMSRLERPTNVAPVAWLPTQVNDLANPINDADGNAPFSAGWSATYSQRDWFDESVFT